MDAVAGLAGIGLLAVVSALVPVVNAEALAVAGVVSLHGSGAPWRACAVVLAVASGQTLGKVALFTAVRRGSEGWSRRLHGTRPRPRHRVVRPVRGVRRLLLRSGRFLGDSRWGTVPLVLLSASTGVPPLAVTTVALAAGRVRTGTFALCCACGRCVRFGAVVVPFLLAS